MDVKRVIGIAAILAAGLVFGIMGSLYFSEDLQDYSPAWLLGPSYTGTVQAVQPTRITLLTTSGPQTFEITRATRTVLLGNSPVTPGAVVKVSYREAKPDKQAKIVKVMKDATPGEAPASPAPDASGSAASPAPGGPGSPAPGGPESPAPGGPESPDSGGPGSPAPGGPESADSGGPESPAPAGPESPAPGAESPTPGSGGSPGDAAGSPEM